ncbi:hypothetical protein AGLY_013676 [Aphis glycines]|uniref:Uncharacterized protein n=1 Tax=Aphis glycines TaxID=307491 RepID=A0A6G0T6Z3_APHGL|nr:hypothetical protein AGLY_013676 [Aphis glycines]
MLLINTVTHWFGPSWFILLYKFLTTLVSTIAGIEVWFTICIKYNVLVLRARDKHSNKKFFIIQLFYDSTLVKRNRSQTESCLLKYFSAFLQKSCNSETVILYCIMRLGWAHCLTKTKEMNMFSESPRIKHIGWVALKINSNMINFEIVHDRPVDRNRLFGRPCFIIPLTLTFGENFKSDASCTYLELVKNSKMECLNPQPTIIQVSKLAAKCKHYFFNYSGIESLIEDFIIFHPLKQENKNIVQIRYVLVRYENYYFRILCLNTLQVITR